MLDVEVVVDTNPNETPFAQALEDEGLRVSRLTLQTGDIVVRSSKWHVVIERKDVNDLLNSYVTYVRNRKTRWIAERERLAGMQGEHPNVISVLLLHGSRPNIDPNWTHSVPDGGSVTGEAFNAALLHTAFNYRIHVVHYTDVYKAVKWIALVARQLAADKICVEEGDANFPPPDLRRKPPPIAPAPKQIAAMLGSLHGVSEDMAACVVKVYPTLKALVKADVTDLAKIPTLSGKKLGPARAKRIHALF
jgi:ERCC4-type nuclease